MEGGTSLRKKSLYSFVSKVKSVLFYKVMNVRKNKYIKESEDDCNCRLI